MWAYYLMVVAGVGGSLVLLSAGGGILVVAIPAIGGLLAGLYGMVRVYGWPGEVPRARTERGTGGRYRPAQFPRPSFRGTELPNRPRRPLAAKPGDGPGMFVYVLVLLAGGVCSLVLLSAGTDLWVVALPVAGGLLAGLYGVVRELARPKRVMVG